MVPDDLWGHEPLGAAEPLGPGGQRGTAYPVVRQFDVNRRGIVVVELRRCYILLRFDGMGLRLDTKNNQVECFTWAFVS